MYKKYIYSHTIQKNQQRQTINVQQKQSSQSIEQKIEEQASDDMEDLFKIGHKKIIQSKARDAQSPIIKQRKIKKQKKQKKDKKKKQKKQKKEKKQKKANKYRESYSDDNDRPELSIYTAKVKQQQDMIQHDAMQKLQHKMKLLSKYQKQLSAYRTKQEQQNILNQQFGLKQKLTDTTLTLDIIKFGMPEIQKYGLQDRQVPFYKRHHKMNSIIGMIKKKKKIDKLIKQLNLITNQAGVNWNKYQNTSLQRYYHFVGYQKLKGEYPQKYYLKNTNQELETNQNTLILSLKKSAFPNNQIKPSILYNPPTQFIVKLLNNQQKLRSINKQYNTALNVKPKDIGLWLKFLDIQDKVSQLTFANSDYQQSILHKNALIQRKLAIVTKALQKNPFDQILGIKHVQFLIAAKKDRRLIQQNIKGLIQVHSDSEQLWKFFLQFKLSSIVDFKHSRLQKQFEQINSYLFQKRINQVKSGKQVWKIRKCGLVILEQVLKIHKLEGYYELCTAICCALLQFNIFCSKQMLQLDRNNRIEYFKSYWQDYSNYKLGQYFNIGIFLQNTQFNYIKHTWEGYQALKSSQPKSQNNNKQIQVQLRQTYIGTIFKQNLKQAKIKSKRWIPTQTLHDSQQIQKLPQTFVMFEDIQIYLQTYRNTQNLQFLCNITVTNLNMPIIFTLSSTNNSQSQYLIQWMANTSMNSRSSVSPYCQHSCLHWSRYWHPILTQQFIGVKNNNIDQLDKFVYTVNLVQCLYFKLQKLLSFIELTQIRQYLMFLYGTIYYLHASTLNKQNSGQKIQNLLKLFPEFVCLSRIKNLLISDSVNINLWSMYIEYESYTGKPVQQCINCYLDCISAIDNSYTYLQQQVQNEKIQLQTTVKKLTVLYWLSQFMYRWGIKISNNSKITNNRIVFFNLLKQLLLENSIKSLTFIQLLQKQDNIQPMQKLLLGNKLMSLVKFISQNENNKKQICVIYYILLQIGQVPSTITPLLLNINTNLSISILIDFGLITYENFIDFNLMTTKMCDLKVVTYFARSFMAHSKGIIAGFHLTWFRECCGNFRKMLSTSINKEQKDYYEQQSKNKLFLWLLLMRILQPEQRQISNQKIKNKQFPQNYINFIQYCLRIAENNLTNTHEPLCMQLLNKLLKKPQFAYSYLNQFPYIQQMYSTASLIVENAQRIQKLVIQKQIRMNYSKINQQYRVNTYANKYIDLTEQMK